MMKVLLNNQRKIMMNSIKSQSLKNYAGFLISLIVMGILLYFLTRGVWFAADLVTDAVLAGVVSYGSLIIFGLIILLGLPQVYKHLYAARDLEFLFTLPIPTRHIFWMKYLQSFTGVPLSGYIFFAIPLCIYGIASDVSYFYYPVALLVLLAVVVIGLSVAYLANLLVIQIVPASKANEFMTIMSFLAGMFVYLLIMLPNIISDTSITDVILSGLPLFPDWAPMSWGSAAITYAANGSVGFVLPLILLLLLAICSLFLTTTLVEKGFRTGWVRLSEGSGKTKKRKNTVQGLSHPIIAVGKKEWLTIKRDLREWLIFMPIGIFVVFVLIGFFSGGGRLGDIREANDISWPIAQAVLLFLYSMFNGNMAASSVGREGASEWVMRVLPLSGKNIAIGKLWISWLIPFVLMTGIEIIAGIFMGWSVLQFVLGIIAKALVTIGISAIGLWLGTLGAKYNPTNPQQRLKFGVSLIMLVLSYAYLVILLFPFGFVMVPIDQIDVSFDLDHGMTGFMGLLASTVLALLSLKASYPVVMTIVGIVVLVLLSIGITVLFIYASAKRFDKGVKIDVVSQTNSKALFGKKKVGGGL